MFQEDNDKEKDVLT